VKWPLKAFPIDQPREKRKKEKKPAHQMMPTYVDGDRTLKNHFQKKKKSRQIRSVLKDKIQDFRVFCFG